MKENNGDKITTEVVNSDARERNFQTFLLVDPRKDVEKVLRNHLSRWLEEKGFQGINLEVSGYYQKASNELRFVHAINGEGVSYQAKLTESTAQGSWRSVFTFSLPKDKREQAWLLIRVSNDQGQTAQPPRLLRYLVEEGLVFDGLKQMPAEVEIYREHMFDDLFAEISDDRRRTPIFVAATDSSENFDQYLELTKTWASRLPGLARFVVMDPILTSTFRDAVGEEIAVPNWTVRTYLPGLAYETHFDPRRHKILSRLRLSAEPHKVQATLNWVARKISFQEEFPSYVISTLSRLQRLEDRTLFDSIKLEPERVSSKTTEVHQPVKGIEKDISSNQDSIAAEVQDYLNKVSLVQEIFGLSSITRESLEEIIWQAHLGIRAKASLEKLEEEFAERQSAIEAITAEAKDLEQNEIEFESEIGELEEHNRKLVERVRNLEKRNQWLYRQIDDVDRYSQEYLEIATSEADARPRDWEEFLIYIGTLKEQGIVFMGDPRDTLNLEKYDDLGNFVRMAWDCILVLLEYVQARLTNSWLQGVDEFIKAEGAFPPAKHARNETGYTQNNSKKNNDRDFPVPTSVAPHGFATMNAHFKVGKKGRIDPRIYYLDNFFQDGNIYIGYVGVHLKNRLS